MYSINTDLSVDTVRVYWQNCHFHAGAGWQHIDKDMFYRKDGDIELTYNIQSYILTAKFSASKIANGCNAFPYEYTEYPLLRDSVENTVLKITGQPLRLSASKISRIDIYRSLIFDDINKARSFVAALNRIPKSGRIKHAVYGGESENDDDSENLDDGSSDYTYLKKGDLVKAYVKNDDIHIPDEISDELPATVRIEVECKGRADSKKIIKGYNTEEILKYPAFWVRLYNTTLNKLGLCGVILKRTAFIKAAKKLITEENPKIRQSTLNKRMEKLRRVIAGKISNSDRAMSGLVSVLRKNGICPCCFDDVKTLEAREVIPAELQRLYEIFSETIAKRKIRAVKNRFCRFNLFDCLSEITTAFNMQPYFNSS
jgi:hypothetical protein